MNGFDPVICLLAGLDLLGSLGGVLLTSRRRENRREPPLRTRVRAVPLSAARRRAGVETVHTPAKSRPARSRSDHQDHPPTQGRFYRSRHDSYICLMAVTGARCAACRLDLRILARNLADERRVLTGIQKE